MRCAADYVAALHARMEARNVAEKSEYVQDPQDDDDDNDRVQNGLDGPLHRNVAIDEPKQNSHHDQDNN